MNKLCPECDLPWFECLCNEDVDEHGDRLKDDEDVCSKCGNVWEECECDEHPKELNFDDYEEDSDSDDIDVVDVTPNDLLDQELVRAVDGLYDEYGDDDEDDDSEDF